MLDTLRALRRPVRLFRNLTGRARLLVAALCAMALVAAGAGAWPTVYRLFHEPCMQSGATDVVHSGPNGECVGITDGAYDFDPSLAAIEKKIKDENARVAGHHYVSVVQMLPISAGNGSVMSMANAREQLEGAYAAQRYANRHPVEGQVRPYIRLLVADDGYQAGQWARAVGIIERHRSADRIAAVTGLGLSLSTTKDAVDELTGQQIPVIGATLTSDDFDDIKDFVRVSPSNAAESRAALSYVQAHFANAILVEDENTADTYDATLVKGFQNFDRLPGHRIIAKETYDTRDRDTASSPAAQRAAENEVANRIGQMSTDICSDPPAVVLFAGRGRDLNDLLGSLSSCTGKHITIMSGDDISNMVLSPDASQNLSHVTVEYADVANPQEWERCGTSETPGSSNAAELSQGVAGYQQFSAAFRQLFPKESPQSAIDAELGDGNAMMAYDAVLTGISAIRITNLSQPGASAVAGELSALQGPRTVDGAGGPLSFTADYSTSTDGSNPADKAIPILAVGPDGTTGCLQLDWAGPPAGLALAENLGKAGQEALRS